MPQVKVFHFPATTVQQRQNLIFTAFGLFQKITHVYGWQRKIISFCNLRKCKNQSYIIVSKLLKYYCYLAITCTVYIPLCFYINQALLLLLCIPNSAHILVLLLYNLKNRLMSEGSCENH